MRAVVFDCPCWDCDLTDRYRLPVVAARLEERGEPEAAAAVHLLAEKSERITAADESWVLMQHLGDAYLDLFFCRPESARSYEALTASAGFSDEEWARGLSHLTLLSALYESQLHLLAELTVPSLLVHGTGDLVVPPVVVEAYRRQVRGSSVHTFAESGHFGYFEEPDAYADVLTAFVTRHCGMPVARRT